MQACKDFEAVLVCPRFSEAQVYSEEMSKAMRSLQSGINLEIIVSTWASIVRRHHLPTWACMMLEV